jgi:DNA-binding MarR family transcriptional regulator
MTHSFGTPQHEAVLGLIRTAASLADALDEVLKPHGLGGAQYNVLRILRGAGEDGLCRNEVRDRMLTRMPDMTRLLDRMEESGLVMRSRDATDRRVVSTRLTEAGRNLVDALDAPVSAVHERRMRKLSDVQLRSLNELLEIIRTTD